MSAQPPSTSSASRTHVKAKQPGSFPSWSAPRCPDCRSSSRYLVLPLFCGILAIMNRGTSVIWIGYRGCDCCRSCWFVNLCDCCRWRDFAPIEPDAFASFITLLLSRWISHIACTIIPKCPLSSSFQKMSLFFFVKLVFMMEIFVFLYIFLRLLWEN